MRFAAAMAAARAAKAPQLTLYRDEPADGSPPAYGILQRPVIRWLGIGGCMVLLSLLLLTLLTHPIGAALGRLIGPGPEWRQERTVAAAHTGRALSARPGAEHAAPMAARPGLVGPMRELAAPVVDRPLAPLPPVPSFKQPKTTP